MDRTRMTSFGAPQPEQATDWQAEKLEQYPTPAEVFRQIGRIILVCLILGLLAHLLIAVIGVY